MKGVRVIKSVMEGGGCVYTQTGSMSNIVIPEASLVREKHVVKSVEEGGGGVYTLTGSMSNTVISRVTVESKDNSMSKRVAEIESGNVSSSRSLEADPVNMESANPGVKMSEKLLSKPKYEIQTLPGGKFNLKLSNNSANNVIIIKKKTRFKHTSDVLGREIQPSRKVVRGENEIVKKFNNIPIVSTPTKRKPVFEMSATDASLLNVLDNARVILPGQHTSESPAKRVKWGQGGPE